MGMNTINWDGSPKGTERLAVEIGHSWLKLENDIVLEWKGGVWCVLNKSNATHIWNSAIQKPILDINPIFTQEMASAGIIPPIGSKVILVEDTGFYSDQCQEVYGEDDGSIVEVVGHAVRPDNNAISVTLFNGKGFVTINPEWVKPLDNRTPKQKAVDAALKLMGFSGGGNIESDLSKIYDMWHNKTDEGE